MLAKRKPVIPEPKVKRTAQALARELLDFPIYQAKGEKITLPLSEKLTFAGLLTNFIVNQKDYAAQATENLDGGIREQHARMIQTAEDMKDALEKIAQTAQSKAISKDTKQAILRAGELLPALCVVCTDEAAQAIDMSIDPRYVDGHRKQLTNRNLSPETVEAEMRFYTHGLADVSARKTAAVEHIHGEINLLFAKLDHALGLSPSRAPTIE